MPEIPEKESYKLSEICRYTDTQPYVLRFWESEFPQLNPGKSGAQRVYTREDLGLVQRIKQLLYEENCTLAGARRKLEDEGEVASGERPAPELEADPRAAAPPAPVPSIDPAEPGMVSRQRYEDAIDEIDHLRLQLKEAEKGQRKAEHALEPLQSELEHCRVRSARVGQRLSRLLESLSSEPGAP